MVVGVVGMMEVDVVVVVGAFVVVGVVDVVVVVGAFVVVGVVVVVVVVGVFVVVVVVVIGTYSIVQYSNLADLCASIT